MKNMWNNMWIYTLTKIEWKHAKYTSLISGMLQQLNYGEGDCM